MTLVGAARSLMAGARSFRLPLFGLDTEYGIAVEGKGAGDLMAESRALVRAYPGPHAGPWNYRGEDPRNDMRGFHVDRLSEDPVDAQFDVLGQRPLPVEEERADRVLTNGARLYNDHGHPEYATPECGSLLDLVTHDKAGERIVLACARARMEQNGGNPVTLFKNNTDFHGSSYGTHENYLVSREIPVGSLIAGLLPFFATRILYAGAGKIGVEPGGDRGVYQLAQRADFFTEEASVDTLYRRPIVNTRDEPHTDARQWRRLHVICGDANMSEYTTALKVGTTYLVTGLLETGWRPPVRLKDPVRAIKDISRDPSHKWLVDVENQGRMPAVDIQRAYLAGAKEHLAGRGSDTDWVLREWEMVLDALERDPLSLHDRLDWVAKRTLLADYIDAEGIDWKHESLPSFDLAYHNLDPEEGLYYALEQAGEMVRLTTDEAIEDAVTNAPPNTRAAIRGAMVARFRESIGAIGWNRIILRHEDQSWLVDLDDYLTPESIAPVMARLEGAPRLTDWLRHFSEK
jgi:proteasome accessory factor PafA2